MGREQESLPFARWLSANTIFQETNAMLQERKKCRVFVVDDEYFIASTLATILCSQGFDATSFTEPLEALRAARADSPDLLISDVVMPVVSGIELAVRILQLCPDCKILLFSGQAATSSMLEIARTNGHNFEVLTKPVHPSDLLRKIREAVSSSAPQPTSELIA
jgi:DNA-binding NtrC family response regulator